MTDADCRERIVRVAETAIGEAQPELTAIVEDVLRQHGKNLFRRPADIEQGAIVLNEILSRGFLLGIKNGITMTLEALEMPSEKKEKEATNE